MRNIDWGWQGKARKLRMRGEYLWEHMPIPADVVFHVPNTTGRTEKIPAHKWMLSIGSQVFFAMFYGPSATKAKAKTKTACKTAEIVSIPNHTADVFKVVLKFLYSDQVPSVDMYRLVVPLKHWMDVLICADQYGIVELVTQGREVLCQAMLCKAWEWGPQPLSYGVWDAAVVYLLQKGREIEDLEIVQAATLQEGMKFLKSPGEDWSLEFVCEFLKQTEVQTEVKEIQIYQAVRTWAQRKQTREEAQGLPRRTLHDILGPVFEATRFPLMSSAEIAEGPVKDKVFTFDELSALYQQQFSTDVSKPRPFADGLRKVKIPLPRGKLKVYVGSSPHRVDLVIQPFTKGVPTTVDKFLRLCAENYQFHVRCDDELAIETSGYKDRLPDSRLTAVQKETLVGLSIPESEKKMYLHDSAGTVALRLCPAEKDSHFSLDISFGNNLDKSSMMDDGVVFGRLVGDMRKTLEYLRIMRLFAPAHSSITRVKMSVISDH